MFLPITQSQSSEHFILRWSDHNHPLPVIFWEKSIVIRDIFLPRPNHTTLAIDELQQTIEFLTALSEKRLMVLIRLLLLRGGRLFRSGCGRWCCGGWLGWLRLGWWPRGRFGRCFWGGLRLGFGWRRRFTTGGSCQFTVSRIGHWRCLVGSGCIWQRFRCIWRTLPMHYHETTGIDILFQYLC